MKHYAGMFAGVLLVGLSIYLFATHKSASGTGNGISSQEVAKVLGAEISNRPVSLRVKADEDLGDLLLKLMAEQGHPVNLAIRDAGPAKEAFTYDGTLGEGLAQLLATQKLIIYRDGKGYVNIERARVAR